MCRALYDRIATAYSAHRRPDERIAKPITASLRDCEGNRAPTPRSREWKLDGRNRSLLELSQLDIGYRLIVARCA
jgi:hypothetical protein